MLPLIILNPRSSPLNLTSVGNLSRKRKPTAGQGVQVTQTPVPGHQVETMPGTQISSITGHQISSLPGHQGSCLGVQQVEPGHQAVSSISQGYNFSFSTSLGAPTIIGDTGNKPVLLVSAAAGRVNPPSSCGASRPGAINQSNTLMPVNQSVALVNLSINQSGPSGELTVVQVGSPATRGSGQLDLLQDQTAPLNMGKGWSYNQISHQGGYHILLFSILNKNQIYK